MHLQQILDEYLPLDTSSSDAVANLNLIFISLDTVTFTVPNDADDKTETNVGLISWIKRIASCMRSKDKLMRHVGISLLGETVSRCDKSTLSTHCGSWTSFATSILSKDQDISGLLALRALKYTLEFASKVPALRRDHAKDALPGVLTTLLSIVHMDDTSTAIQRMVLETLEVCALQFPGPTRQFVAKIKKAVLVKFDSHSNIVAEAAASCYAHLPACANAKAHSDTWFAMCSELVGTAHELLTSLFNKADEEDIWHGVLIRSLKLETPPAGDIAVTLAASLRRLQAVLLSIRKMISVSFVAAVPVPIDAILGLSSRIIGMDSNYLLDSRAHNLLAGLLPALHADAFLTLDALIQATQTYLIPHSELVLQLFSQALGRKGLPGTTKQTIYDSLRQFLRNSGVSIHSKLLQDYVKTVIVDCEPTTELNEDASVRKLEQDRRKVCRGALKALKAILLVSCGELSVQSHEQLAGFLLKTILKFGCLFPEPYNDAKCRLDLYDVFRAYILTASGSQPTCIPHAATLFRLGMKDDDIEVRYFCIETMVIIDQLIHPITASLPRKSTYVRTTEQSPPDASSVTQSVCVEEMVASNEYTASIVITGKESQTDSSGSNVQFTSKMATDVEVPTSAVPSKVSNDRVFEPDRAKPESERIESPNTKKRQRDDDRVSEKLNEEPQPTKPLILAPDVLDAPVEKAPKLEESVPQDEIILPTSTEVQTNESDDDIEIPEVLDEESDSN